jgi:Cellulase (glycosyl hydrolase family 5)
MKPRGWVFCVALAVSSQACGGTASHSGDDSAGGSGGGASPTPWFTLPAGSRYFAQGGRQAPLLLRNISAPSAAEFVPLLQAAHAAGATAVRVQLTQGFGYGTLGMDAHGGVLPAFAASWDAVITAAREEQLAVIPVFAIWGDWNSGTPALNWVHFTANPLNQALGGPAATPKELFSDTETQRAWLGWVSTLVDRWQKYPNIIAWELFSELDLATGADQASATSFAERASDVVRAHDPQARPVFASTSDLPLINNQPWTDLWRSRGADLVSIHPYDANLDQVATARTNAALLASDKPVFIGESGLDAAPPDGTTLTSSAAARAGLQQAVWAELVSGAATARALYWEDGYAVYYPQTGLPLVQAMNDLDSAAAAWLSQADYTGLAPATLSSDMPSFSLALASDDSVRGWTRSTALAPPAWSAPAQPAMTLTIALPAPAADGNWFVTFTPPTNEVLPSALAQSTGGALFVHAPGGYTSLAFVATRVL